MESRTSANSLKMSKALSLVSFWWPHMDFLATTWNIVAAVFQLMSEVWSYFLIFPSALKSIWRDQWDLYGSLWIAAIGCNGSQPPSQPLRFSPPQHLFPTWVTITPQAMLDFWKTWPFYASQAMCNLKKKKTKTSQCIIQPYWHLNPMASMATCRSPAMLLRLMEDRILKAWSLALVQDFSTSVDGNLTSKLAHNSHCHLRLGMLCNP